VAGHHHLSWLVGTTASLGMLIAIGVWWIYFDFLSQHIPITKRATAYGWIYLHVPVTIGIVAAGAAVLNVVEHAGQPLTTEVRWVLVGAIAIALTSIALLMRTIQIPKEHQQIYRRGFIVTLVPGCIILLLGFSGLHTIPLLVVLNLLLLTPVIYGVVVWIKVSGAREIPM
jgi:low temperature requirement protein LtrA